MMQNVVRLTGSVAIASAFAEAARAFAPLKWGFACLLVLLVVDYRYTRRHRLATGGSLLPHCTALRRFFNKLIDYMLYIVAVAVLAVVFEGVINPEVTRWVGLGVVFAIEAASLLHKWLAIYHPDIDFDIFALLGERWRVFRHIKRKDRNAVDKTGEDRPDIRGGEDTEGGDQA